MRFLLKYSQSIFQLVNHSYYPECLCFDFVYSIKTCSRMSLQNASIILYEHGAGRQGCRYVHVTGDLL